jgi:hypothetical protein
MPGLSPHPRSVRRRPIAGRHRLLRERVGIPSCFLPGHRTAERGDATSFLLLISI